MNSVHSPEMKVTITGNMITHHDVRSEHVMFMIGDRSQASIHRLLEDHDSYDVSYAMNDRDHKAYAGLIHRLNSENMLNKKVDANGKGPDNDGPKPTNPRGSGGKVVEQENTFAVAA